MLRHTDASEVEVEDEVDVDDADEVDVVDAAHLPCAR